MIINVLENRWIVLNPNMEKRYENQLYFQFHNTLLNKFGDRPLSIIPPKTRNIQILAKFKQKVD